MSTVLIEPEHLGAVEALDVKVAERSTRTLGNWGGSSNMKKSQTNIIH